MLVLSMLALLLWLSLFVLLALLSESRPSESTSKRASPVNPIFSLIIVPFLDDVVILPRTDADPEVPEIVGLKLASLIKISFRESK